MIFDCSSFLFLNSLAMFIKMYHFYTTRVIFCKIFYFLKRKVLINFKAEENTSPFKRLDYLHYLGREIPGPHITRFLVVVAKRQENFE